MQKRTTRAIRSRAKKNDLSHPQNIKLAVSAGIFLSLVLIKLFDPAGAAQLSGAVNTYIGDQTPTTIQAIGQAITSGDSIVEVFKNLSAALTGAISTDEDNPTDEPSATPSAEVRASFAPTVLLPEDDDIYTEPTAADDDARYSFETIPVAYEGELVSGGGFGVDDTLPLPFGYDAPPNVDFSMHAFSFEHTSPINGVLTSRFGYRNHPVQNEQLFHYGVDLAANTGTDILSFADGVVTNTGKSDTYGNYVLVSHADGVSSFYAHCNKILVKQGAKVTMGQKIALVGSTGTSTGPHVHFELRLDGKLLDPEFYITVNE